MHSPSGLRDAGQQVRISSFAPRALHSCHSVDSDVTATLMQSTFTRLCETITSATNTVTTEDLRCKAMTVRKRLFVPSPPPAGLWICSFSVIDAPTSGALNATTVLGAWFKRTLTGSPATKTAGLSRLLLPLAVSDQRQVPLTLALDDKVLIASSGTPGSGSGTRRAKPSIFAMDVLLAGPGALSRDVLQVVKEFVRAVFGNVMTSTVNILPDKLKFAIWCLRRRWATALR